MSNIRYHYTYFSYEEWGRGYIGRRSSKCLPEDDTQYFGSFSDKTFKPTQKIILQTYKTQEEAVEAEVVLHDFYEVDVNPYFANRARQTSKKFYLAKHSEDTKKKLKSRSKFWLGKTRSEETKKKISAALKGDKNPNSGKAIKPFLGKTHSEEARQKMSKAAKKRKPVSEETRQKMSEAKKKYYEIRRNLPLF